MSMHTLKKLKEVGTRCFNNLEILVGVEDMRLIFIALSGMTYRKSRDFLILLISFTSIPIFRDDMRKRRILQLYFEHIMYKIPQWNYEMYIYFYIYMKSL